MISPFQRVFATRVRVSKQHVLLQGFERLEKRHLLAYLPPRHDVLGPHGAVSAVMWHEHSSDGEKSNNLAMPRPRAAVGTLPCQVSSDRPPPPTATLLPRETEVQASCVTSGRLLNLSELFPQVRNRG